MPRLPIYFFLLFLFFSPALFAQSDTCQPAKVVIDQIVITGNKITRESIIRRELLFKEGDTLASSFFEYSCEQSKRNLLNTLLFNFVTVEGKDVAASSLKGDSLNKPSFCVGYTHVIVHIDFKERWYTWPIPIFEFYDQNFNTWWLNRNFDRLDYGMYLTRTNFLGRKQVLTLTCRLGYAEQYGISYSIPYINKKQHSGLSFSVVYNRTHQIPYETEWNKFLYYTDDLNHVRKDLTSRIAYTYRQGFYNTYLLDIRYTHAQIADSLARLSQNYFADGLSTMDYFSLNLGFIRDRRDSKAYPLNGYYINVGYNKSGLGILPNEHLDIWQVGVILRRYVTFTDRISGGVAFKGRWSGNSSVPYYLQSTIGFRDYIRGYEYYVVDGQSYGLLKNVLRYQIIKTHVRRIPFIPLEKFNTFHYALYGGLFCDLAYVQDRYDRPELNNSLSNAWLYGYGAGIDFVTYYDFVLRLEYSFNKIGENGFFIHLNSPL